MNDRNLVFGCYGLNGHQILDPGSQVTGMRIQAVAGTEQQQFERAHATATESPKWYPDLAGLLNDPEIDAVSLCSARPDEQAEHTIKALGAGRYVYAEKPLATNSTNLARVRDAWKKSGRELRAMTGAVYVPAAVYVRELVA